MSGSPSRGKGTANMTDRGSSGTRQMNAMIEEKGITRVQAAIDITHLRRHEARTGVNPTVLFVVGVVRNFVLGAPCVGMGFIFGYKAMVRLDKHLTTEPVAWHDLIPFAPSLALLLAGFCFIAPGQMEGFARFLGLGGIIDKIIDRIPFLKPRSLTP